MRKINILITTILLASILLLPMVLAATTLTSPVTSGNYSGTMTLTATTLINDSNTAYNVTFYYNASGGATATKLVTVTNTSAAQNTFTSASYSITGLTDGMTYNFSAYADNGTDQQWSTGVGLITIDNTKPTCTLKKIYNNPEYKGLQELIWTSSDALSLVSTVTTIDRPQSGSDMVYTDANRDLTLLSTDTNFVGEWTATTVATDRAGNTETCTSTWKTDSGGYSEEQMVENAKEEAQTESTSSFFGLPGWLIVIIIIGIVFLIVKDQK